MMQIWMKAVKTGFWTIGLKIYNEVIGSFDMHNVK